MDDLVKLNQTKFKLSYVGVRCLMEEHILQLVGLLGSLLSNIARQITSGNLKETKEYGTMLLGNSIVFKQTKTKYQRLPSHKTTWCEQKLNWEIS